MKRLIIDSCKACPFYHIFDEQAIVCTHPSRDNRFEMILNTNMISKDCPLPDDAVDVRLSKIEDRLDKMGSFLDSEFEPDG